MSEPKQPDGAGPLYETPYGQVSAQDLLSQGFSVGFRFCREAVARQCETHPFLVLAIRRLWPGRLGPDPGRMSDAEYYRLMAATAQGKPQ